MAILTGILLGLGTMLFDGPVFFYLLKSTLESGFKAGIAVALGIILGDVICAAIALSWSQSFLNNTLFDFWASIIGGSLLLIIGLKYTFKPNLNTTVKAKIKKRSTIFYFANGFLINFINPFVFAIWKGFVSYNQSLYNEASTLLSIGITLLVIFSTDVLKAFFAQRLSHFIQPKDLGRVFQVFGIVMIGFAIRLLTFPFL